MDNAKGKKNSDVKASLGTFSDFCQSDESDEIDDPISAYFKQRCSNSNKIYFKKSLETNRDSSVGLIDIDNISLFDDGVEQENTNLRFSEQMLEMSNGSFNIKKNRKQSEVKFELDKQRALAQKALKKLSCNINESQNEKSVLASEKRESKALIDISSKLMNELSTEKGLEKDWFQPNFSPNTPRVFNDELSSFGVEDENAFVIREKDNFTSEEISKYRQSVYAKKVNLMLKEPMDILVPSDTEFESQTKEEQINRFEEDEKKFKLENSALLHNSQISQFSGIVGEDISQWPSETFNLKPESDNKNLSIGQFFNMRSNRISSLVGSVAKENSLPDLGQIKEDSVTSEPQAQPLSKSEYSFPLGETFHMEKPKFRRCVSTYDLKKSFETPKNVRYSSDSCSSNSTLMIQDILAEMESGLSGTQMYEKLMKSYGRRQNEGKAKNEVKKKEKAIKISENSETPKRSKIPKRKDMVKSTKKEPKNPNGQISVLSCDKEFREDKAVDDLKSNETVFLARDEKIKKIGSSKGFYASTPKTHTLKSPNDKFKNTCGKVLMNQEDWEAPRVNSIQPIDLNKSEGSEENEKTITVNSTTISSELNKKNNTILINDTLTVEDTIVAGDLTVISQRIEEMKRDSVCIVRSVEPEEPVLLTVIQKLASLPKGSLDCSALTPLLRDQFPELLSNFPKHSKESSMNDHSTAEVKVQDTLNVLPGSWVKLPDVWGVKERVYACADLEKIVLIPIFNISQNWLLVSLESLELVHSQGKKLPSVKKNNEWCVLDFVVVSIKETIIPPDNNKQSLKVFFKSGVAAKLELILKLAVKELMNGEVQTRSFRLFINNVNPKNYINVLPRDPINFGVIADQCYDQTTVQICFEGICELPLTIYIKEDESISDHFILKPYNGQKHEKEWNDKIYHHVFLEGEKQVFEFRIVFQPNVLLNEDSKTENFKALLIIMLGSKTDTDGILRTIPIKGSVGFAKFLCNPSCSPLVFRASEPGHCLTRSYPLKNVGSLPIALSVSIMNEEREVIEGEDVFVVPKSFYLSKNEQAGINITFKACSSQNFTKRYLKLQIKPNGRVIYEAELIGIITCMESRPGSRSSGISVFTKSGTNLDSVPMKLLTTALSLSWAAVSLEKEARQTFQIKSLSKVTISVRVTFGKNLDSFKLMNENGEKVFKLRKILKPDCPCTLTVIFRPDIVGAHNTSLMFETSHSSCKKKILLNGIGGMPNVLMRNVKSDLNGCKILRLQHSRNSNQFESVIIFKNEGRIPAFLLVKLGVKDFSLSHELIVSPPAVIIHPDSTTSVKISQKLKNSDLQQLLSEREIRKIATICVITGDEPSRLRIKKLVDKGKLQATDRLKMFTENFHDEKEMYLKNFKDSPGFENGFLKSLKVHEVAVVVEKSAEINEPSILEETTDEFISFISDNSVITTVPSQRGAETESNVTSQKSNPINISATFFCADSLKSLPSHNRVTKWLETIDCS